MNAQQGTAPAATAPTAPGATMHVSSEDRVLARARRHGRLVLIVFSGDFDKWMAAFTLATTAASMGIEVRMFFTFWGILGLRERRRFARKPWLDKLLGVMLPSGLGRSVSRMNFCGLGAPFFEYVMRRKGVTGLRELVALAKRLGVKLTVCQLSMATMGVAADELVDGVEFAGASRAVADIQIDATTLFI